MSPISAFECNDTNKVRALDSPNAYIKQTYLGDEMTVLGWAVYFGYGPQAEESIKNICSHRECDPFLPMKSGFFRGKTAKDIAEYYQRKNLISIIDACERSKDPALRTAADAAKKQLEDEGGPLSTAPKPRRKVQLLRAIPGGPDKKPQDPTREEPISPTALRKAGSTVQRELPQNNSSPAHRDTIKDELQPATILDPAVRKEKEKEVLDFLEKANISVDDQVLVSSTLVKAGFTDVDSIKRADSTTLQRLKIKPLVVSKLVAFSSSESVPLKAIETDEKLEQAAPEPVMSPVERTIAPATVVGSPIKSESKRATLVGGPLKEVPQSVEPVKRATIVERRSTLVGGPMKELPKGAPAPRAAAVLPVAKKSASAMPRSPSPLAEDPAERVPVSPPSPREDESFNQPLASPKATTPALSIIASPVSKRFHVYLSFNWGPQQIYRSRCKLLARALENRGAIVWLTEDRAEDDVVEAITRGLESSVCFVACLTKSYMEKTNAMKTARFCADWCAIEFNFAVTSSSMGPHRIMPVVLEPSMRDQTRWTGEFQSLKSASRQVPDFTSELNYETVCEGILAFASSRG